VVGCSWGGFDALGEILGRLPANFPAAIAVAQHRAPGPTANALASFLERRGSLRVSDAEDKEPVERGRVYLAPADYHLLIEGGSFALSVDARVQQARPSIDVLFESAADAFGDRVVAVMLTGANSDGAQGLVRVRRHGGYALVQDPETAVRREMPDAAIATGAVDAVLPLDQIAAELVALCTNGRPAPGRRSPA
jgi:two-component system, chemotaxis family, protein-glutamate methylesterase/glutaminase